MTTPGPTGTGAAAVERLVAAARRIRHASSTPADWVDGLAHLRGRHDAGGRLQLVGGPGDSITEGIGASERRRGWWSVLADEVRAACGLSSRAIGSAELSLVSTGSVWTASGPAPRESGLSLGRYSLTLLPGTVLSTRQAFDRLTLLYSPMRAGGALEVRIDGDVAATLEPRGSRDELSVRWCSPPAAFDDHVVELRCTAGPFVFVDHAYFHDGDADDGPMFWRCGHNRFNAGGGNFGFTEATVPWMGAFTRQPLIADGPSDEPIFGAGSIAADCFLSSTGTNDIEVFGNDRRRLTEAYVNLIRYVRAHCDTPASIGLVVPTSSSRYGGDYRNVHAAAADACRSEEAFLIDLWHDLGTHGDDRDGFHRDGLHPNDRGHAAWAQHVAAWLLVALGEIEP